MTPAAVGERAGQRRIHVCENPAVLAAAADAYGPECPPMVCVQGQPSTAALTLLRRMCDQGVALRYHGDFDWGGLRIASTLFRSVPWSPWRFTAADYRAAVASDLSSLSLTGMPTDAPWDASSRGRSRNWAFVSRKKWSSTTSWTISSRFADTPGAPPPRPSRPAYAQARKGAAPSADQMSRNVSICAPIEFSRSARSS
ncbi:DUF2399 domain-containing protein [Streptomyces sp. M19]